MNRQQPWINVLEATTACCLERFCGRPVRHAPKYSEVNLDFVKDSAFHAMVALNGETPRSAWTSS